MDKRYAIIGPDSKAINFILWDGVSEFDYGQHLGNSLVPLEGVEDYGFEWTWNGNAFVAPPPPPEPV